MTIHHSASTTGFGGETKQPSTVFFSSRPSSLAGGPNGPLGSLNLGKSAEVNPMAVPIETFTQKLRTAAEANANAVVLHVKQQAELQGLLAGYQTWENNLREEARKRLTFQPPPSLLSAQSSLLNDDWDLLRRVKSNGTVSLHAAMKRSASETSLETMSPQRKQAHSSNKHWTFEHYIPEELEPEQHSHYPTHHAVTTGDLDGDGAGLHLPPAPFAQGTGSGPKLLLPKVPTAPSLQELQEQWVNNNDGVARNLEAVAQTILQRSRLALQSAQQSIQQTATNCQQNLQALSSALQHNLVVAPGGLTGAASGAGAYSGSVAIVPWQVHTAALGISDPGSEVSSSEAAATGNAASASGTGDAPVTASSGAIVPWAVFPRYLRARESEQDADAPTSSELQEWYAPFEKYIENLEHTKRIQSLRQASLREPGRQVAIVTTASLPWLTGTAVNPLLRAAYLSSSGDRKVTLVLPWLSHQDQQTVFPNDLTFNTPEEQEEYVRQWARNRTGLECNFKVAFYPGRYAAEKGSILPVGDITTVIPDHEADVAVLEEPEHLNWFHHGRRWTDKFAHVVGVMHTNYLDYARREEGGAIKEALLKHINAWMCRIYCHKVIKLSDAVQPLPRQDTMFVHGVSPSFLKVGQKKALAAAHGERVWTKDAYFLGKVLWAKGYTELLDRLNEHTSATGHNIHVDVYGSGPDLKAVEEEARRRRLDLAFKGARDHADTSLQDYKVFINPSLSDVVATTTAEALAMGKFVLCAEHPSNKFFEQFPNCLVYRTPDEFSKQLDRALSAEPQPLSQQQLHSLTWEAATERFLDIAELRPGQLNPLDMAVDNVLATVHNVLTGNENLRVLAGAGAKTRDMPARITDYVPVEDCGGMFDDKSRAKRIHNEQKSKVIKKQVQQA